MAEPIGEQPENNVDIIITEQTFFDLGMWLSDYASPSKQQICRLQQEAHYLALIQLANSYWLIGPLTNQFKAKSVFNDLPEQMQEYLTELESLVFHRSNSIINETIFAIEQLHSKQIQSVILKGAAMLFNGAANPISNRYMTDIDILVHEDAHQHAVSILKASGYAPYEEDFYFHPLHHHHAPAMIRENGECYVELHRSALKQKVSAILTNNEIWENSVPLKLTENLSTLELSPTHQVILSVAHSEISHEAYTEKQLDLHQLHNLFCLINFHQNAIDWAKVSSHFKRTNQYNILTAALYSCFKLFNITTPITDTENKAAKEHFENCLHLFSNRQSSVSKFYFLKLFLNGYSKDSILLAYGNKGRFPVLKGRVKFFTRHLKMAFTPKLLKRFVNKIFG